MIQVFQPRALLSNSVRGRKPLHQVLPAVDAVVFLVCVGGVGARQRLDMALEIRVAEVPTEYAHLSMTADQGIDSVRYYCQGY